MTSAWCSYVNATIYADIVPSSHRSAMFALERSTGVWACAGFLPVVPWHVQLRSPMQTIVAAVAMPMVGYVAEHTKKGAGQSDSIALGSAIWQFTGMLTRLLHSSRCATIHPLNYATWSRSGAVAGLCGIIHVAVLAPAQRSPKGQSRVKPRSYHETRWLDVPIPSPTLSSLWP